MSRILSNISGQTVGRLRIAGPVRMIKDHSAGYGCLCDCGKWTIARTGDLTRQNWPTRSCGCGKKSQPDLIGKKFSRLTVIGPCRKITEGQAAWGCKCECGKWTVAMTWQLKNKTIQSCGCLIGDSIREYHQRKKEEEKNWVNPHSLAMGA